MNNQQQVAREMPAANSMKSRRYSKNFWDYEFDCRDGTMVPEGCEDKLEAFVQSNLQVIRDFFGVPIYITSAYRTERYNKAVGGVENSFHLYDIHGPNGHFAVDIAVQGVSPIQVKFALEGLIRLNLIEEGGIGLYKDFVHYDNRGVRKRW